MTANDERRKEVDFSETYYTATQGINEAEEYAIAVKKGNTELLNAINEVIAELKATGKLDEIINKYQNK